MSMLALLALGIEQTVVQSPNIVVIFSDDHARQAISAYGSKLTKTPGIDRLAKEGIIFRRHYTSNPICAPSRASLLTGKYSHKNGHKDNGSTFDGSQEILPKLLKRSGYESAFIGKWHLVSNPEGFDYWEIVPGQGDYHNPRFLTKDGMHSESGYTTNIVTNKALTWMRAPRKNPFILFVGHKAPHRNWVPPMEQLSEPAVKYPEPATLRTDHQGLCSAAKTVSMSIDRDLRLKEDLLLHTSPPRLTESEKSEWLRLSAPNDKVYDDAIKGGSDLMAANYQRYLRNYLGAAKKVDDSVSEILNELEKSGQAKNTIVIYASDQGFFLGEKGWYDKRWFYEPSSGTPFIVRGPGIKKGEVKQVTSNVDLAPTILELAGLKVPGDIQGSSLLPLLQGKKLATKPAYAHYYESDDGQHNAPQYVAIATDRYKIMFYYELDEWEIFDVKRDPQESKNLWLNGVAEGTKRDLVRRLIERQRELDEEPKYIQMTESSAKKAGAM